MQITILNYEVEGKFMQFYFEPDPGNDAPAVVRMVVEIPKDSSNKYEYDAHANTLLARHKGSG